MTNEKDNPEKDDSLVIRKDDFVSLYANNVQFFASVWDFKFVFGELDQQEGKTSVHQHTAMSVPWAQAKLMHYFLDVNIAIHEMAYGKVRVPDEVLPPEVVPVPDDLKDDSRATRAYEILKKAREQFIANNLRDS